ncbi:MAG TPA: ferric reductase-like transmembrane domain-containing protein [Solirubrobacteraceae bacterium]
MSSGGALWYLTRGAGAVSLVLLTTTMLMGIGNWTRWASARWPRRLGIALHRNVSLLAVTFVVVHVVSAVADGYVDLRLIDAIVPFGAGYRPFWTGLGALAFDCLLALVVTSLLQRRLGWKRWRATHWLAYACWPIAVVHCLGIGTDAGTQWFTLLAAACIAAVLGAGLARAGLGSTSLPWSVRRIAHAAGAPSGAQPGPAPALRSAARPGGRECHAAQARHKSPGT